VVPTEKSPGEDQNAMIERLSSRWRQLPWVSHSSPLRSPVFRTHHLSKKGERKLFGLCLTQERRKNERQEVVSGLIDRHCRTCTPRRDSLLFFFWDQKAEKKKKKKKKTNRLGRIGFLW
jgi:hypothetical protein